MAGRVAGVTGVDGGMTTVRVLGLDPGLRHTGWGVVDVTGNRLTHVADGAVHSQADSPLAERLCQLHDALSEVLARHRPDEAAVEETFVNTNAASTLKLGQARAVSLLVPAQAGLPVAEYTNNMVKKAVVGAGRADKTQVQMMVRVLLPGCAIGTADAADALAVAICHAHHRNTWTAWRKGAAVPLAPSGNERRALPRSAANLERSAADLEKSLWQKLSNGRMGAVFRRQEPILGFTVEFVAHGQRVAIALEEGRRGEGTDGGLRRVRMLEQAGFRVLRFWNDDLNDDLDAVLASIRSALGDAPALSRLPGGSR